MEGLITVRTFSLSTEFEMAKSYLESCEIECFGQDEIINRDYVNASGGMKLQVRTEQAEEAIKILMEGGYLKAEDFEPTDEMKWVTKILKWFGVK